jgi:adenosine deaminase
VDIESIRALPKVLLHDHLDGGLRPRSIVELAADIGYHGLPTGDAGDLARWFHQGGSGSLERYLAAFGHTVAVMQTGESLRRVAREAVEDVAADGVVYAEIRFAPSLHRARGLDRDEVIEAVLTGVGEGSAATGIDVGVIVDAMRQEGDSLEVAKAAVAFAGGGVVGFDLAGPEAGYPPTDHLEACRAAQAGGLGLTIHAGEGDGPESIRLAVEECGAGRIGHGVRIVEDATVEDGRMLSLGPVAAAVRDRSIPLEVSPTSNVHTHTFPSPAAHPVGLLHREGFVVTLNTDNRLMSGISLSDEFATVMEVNGLEVEDLRRITLQAARAAFCTDEVRARVLRRVEDGYPG